MIVGLLCGLLVLVVVFGAVAFVKDVRATLQPGCDRCLGYGKCDHCGRGHKRHHFADLEGRYGWDEDGPRDKPTKLDKVVEAYMKSDPFDPSSTINFQMEVAALEDPFADALPPTVVKYDGRPKRAASYDVLNDLARSYTMTYGVPSHSLQCEVCKQIGSFSNGQCHACGSKPAHHPSWAIWFDGRAVDYLDKRRMEEDAYQLQKDGKKITIFDSYGKQLFVPPPPVLMQSGSTKRIGLSNRWRDDKGRFCKSPEYGGGMSSIHPMDEPYPIHIMPPPFETEALG